MAGTKSLRLSAYAAVLVVAIGLVQVIASVSFYRAIDARTLREDHARRVAELLVVSERVSRLRPEALTQVMTSGHLEVALADRPTVERQLRDPDLGELAVQIVRWEPSLSDNPLHLAIVRAEKGRRDFIGSMQLADGHWLNFESQDISSMWPIALRATWMTVITALVCLALALLALRVLTHPLRRMSEAARAIGGGRRVVIRETGPTDLQNLAHAMNEMQDRIAHLVEDQARSFEAIGHDLRTPLARQKIAAELVEDPELGPLLLESNAEMEALLDSLQQFLRAQHLRSEPEPVDLHELLQAVVAPLGECVRLDCPEPAVAETYREPVQLALAALIENACRYAPTAQVTVRQQAGEWRVTIVDNGPGIPSRHFADVLEPFFRLDEARGRTTKGFGLGIPMAHRLLTRFGGGLSFADGAGGGLEVTVRIPMAG
ncbi:signal transduction histidine kinase [Novosphingobium chloroacetimidivorans]|uniref:histidine kinase n=1 Tax=Novosphingobium chloroacetimidivorans TaxID=1428314 RepID=A0A7W7K741_9SPHN|nr:HAMP domain-containing sensor histidine kinase [Novosphingobium chloroacetimidivorans]MBB4857474.1 signal transduction histidine kinase [Novosphingobium chloroacetimidivorans]